jgi:hypothetical protein
MDVPNLRIMHLRGGLRRDPKRPINDETSSAIEDGPRHRISYKKINETCNDRKVEHDPNLGLATLPGPDLAVD